jgi:purine-nucleoside phosphorylase
MHAATDVLRSRTLSASLPTPALGLVLGSGFAGLASLVDHPLCVPFADLPGFATPTVPGHAGRILLGSIAGTPVAVLEGRAHYYEGHDPATVTLPVRVLAELGVRTLVLTNAAGGIREDLTPGDLVCLTDHLNLMGFNPLRGPGGAERFVDLSEVYSARLRHLMAESARDLGIPLRQGVYAAVSGPSYETPAEIRALRTLGADLVGMSTVPEAIVARQCRLGVVGVSCVSNKAAGLGGPISHEEVIATGLRVRDTATRLIQRFVERLGRQSDPGLPGAASS